MVSSCNHSEFDMVLQELDNTIAVRDSYIDSLNKAINTDRKALYNASRLEDKYIYAEKLFSKFKSENADSAIYYSNLSYM